MTEEKSLFIKKSRITLIVLSLISWIIYVAGLWKELYLLADIFSPLCSLFVLICLVNVACGNRRYRVPILFLAAGVLFWNLGDIAYFFYYEGLTDSIRVAEISNLLYENTSYAYTLSCLSFLWIDYREKNIISLLVNTFLFAVAVYVLTTAVLGAFLHKNFNMHILGMKEVINVFVAMFIIVLILMLIVEKGFERQTASSISILLSFFIYGVFDIRYTYFAAAGIDAESLVVDAIFLFSIVLLGTAFIGTQEKKMLFKDGGKDIQDDNSLGLVLCAMFFVFGFFLFMSGAMAQSNFFILLITSMAYLLVMKMLQVNELNTQLLEHQKKQREELQHRVRNQQQELNNVSAKLENATSIDTLTGLKNRSYWRHYSDEMSHKNGKGRLILYAIDVNFFKLINDNYGHTAGDRVLIEIANRLNSLKKDNMETYRMGGDQFLVSVYEENSPFDITVFAQSIVDAMDKNFEIGEVSIAVTVCVGVAVYPDNTDNLEKLLNYAESARTTVKHVGKTSSYAFFDADSMPKIQRKLTIEQKLQNADYDSHFQMYFQPQVEAASGNLIGMEALVRWIDPELGFISPGEFIPIAEEMGVMSSLGQWISIQSMKQINEWNTRYGRNLVVGINVSPAQLKDDTFIDRFTNMMSSIGVKSDWLDIEITEGIALDSTGQNVIAIDRLKAAGLTLSVDDFGTGYAAFADMINFNFDRIKIAKELVDNLETNNDAKVIVGAIIGMAKGMNLKAIAEGVETKEQRDILVELGCDQIQGYFFGKPIPADEFESIWLK